MSNLTIGEMLKLVPEGQRLVFEPTLIDPAEERFFEIWQNWDYYPGRLDWLNKPSLQTGPWPGTRQKSRIPVMTLSPPHVIFNGPAKDVVDYYDLSKYCPFISDRLFKLIEEVDPGSLDHIEFMIRAEDGDLPFHAVMSRRVLAAVDTQRTKILVEDELLATMYVRKVRFPEGIKFKNKELRDVSNFTDVDSPL